MAENNQYWEQLISKGISFLQEQNNDAAAAVLKKSTFDVEHTYHDSWRWGTDYWALVFYLKNRDYMALGDKKDQLEKDIMSALVTFQKGSRDLLSTVSIRTTPESKIELEKDHPLQKAAEDADLFIREGRYDPAFDCIYSAFYNYLRHLPTDQNGLFETDNRTKTILQRAEEIMDTINELRHNTATHPGGQMLENRDAQLAVSLATSIVEYIEDVERPLS